MSNESELRALDVEFTNSATMTVKGFEARRAAILARAAAAPPAPPAPARAPATMTNAQWEAIADDLVKAVTGYIARAVAPLQARIKELEGRPAGMSYRGVYRDGEAYHIADWCTHNGSLWYCHAPTKETPGQSQAWQLAVKRGANGRDARP